MGRSALTTIQSTTMRLTLVLQMSVLILLALAYSVQAEGEDAAERRDYSCKDRYGSWCKRHASRPNFCYNNYDVCTKSYGGVRCGSRDGCYDELSDSKCAAPKACRKYGRKCKKTCNRCEFAP